jgi:transposase
MCASLSAFAGAGYCQSCGGTTLAPLPQGLEPGTPFSLNIVALAIYLRFTHAISYRRLSRLMAELFELAISEGALDAAFRRAMPCLDAEVGAILARLRRARVVCSDETEVVIHVIRTVAAPASSAR